MSDEKILKISFHHHHYSHTIFLRETGKKPLGRRTQVRQIQF